MAKETIIPLNEVEQVALAYVHLSEGRRTVKADNSDKTEAFEFGDKDARWKFTKCLGILRRKLKEIEKHRKSLVKIHTGESTKPLITDGKPTPGMEDQFAAFAKEWEEFIEKEEKIEGLLPVQYGDLKVNENRISSSALEFLVRYSLVEGLPS